MEERACGVEMSVRPTDKENIRKIQCITIEEIFESVLPALVAVLPPFLEERWLNFCWKYLCACTRVFVEEGKEKKVLFYDERRNRYFYGTLDRKAVSFIKQAVIKTVKETFLPGGRKQCSGHSAQLSPTKLRFTKSKCNCQRKCRNQIASKRNRWRRCKN